MIIRWIVGALIAFVCATPLAAAASQPGNEKFGNTPLVFEPNYGQADSSVRFLSRGDRYGLFLTDTEAIISLTGPNPALVRMQLAGQNPHPKISGSGIQPGASHYFKGTDASKWQQSIPHFLKVDYEDVYPGIDLTYYGDQRQFEYDFTVGPHANPNSIQLKFEGVERIEIGSKGDLILHTSAGEIRHQAPRVFQNRNGIEETVEGQFVLLGSKEVGFQIGKYDANLPLVIDPKFVYSSYFGGVGANGDFGFDIKVDSQGSAYLTGYTSSTDFFTTNLSDTAPGGGVLDAFVMKLDPTGTVVLSAMYYGGSGEDEGHRIALDSIGRVYLTGYTKSADFPIVGGFQARLGGKKDAYIMQVDNAVSRILYSSYLGGSNDDQPFGLFVDASDSIYVAGQTGSTDFPTFRPIQAKFGNGSADAFLTKIAQEGTMTFSTYLGGQGNDNAYDVTADAEGNAYVVGYTTAAIPNTFNLLYGLAGDPEQGFVTKISPNGSAVLLFAYIGGAGTDEAVRVALDSDSNVIISGYTNSPNFPIANATQVFNRGAFDIFVMKLRPNFDDLIFSTYIGSDGSESAPGLAVAPNDDIFLAGFTSSFEFPVVNGIDVGIFGGNLRGDRDAFVTKLDPWGRMLFSTYIGGRDIDGAAAIAVDSTGNAYVTGFTLSPDFPLKNEFQSELAQAPPPGATDGFVLKIDSNDVVVTTAIAVPPQGLSSLGTVGASNSVQFAHATIEVATGAIRPAGMAILDLRQGGGEVGEAAFPLLPYITDVVVYVNENGAQSTNLAMVNPSADPIEVFYLFTNRVGAQSNAGSFIIPPFSSFAQPVTNIPIRLPINSVGTLTISTTAPLSAMAFRSYNESNSSILLTYLPLNNFVQHETRPMTIPQFTSDKQWSTEFLLVNHTDEQMTGVLRFYSTGPDQTDPSQSATNIEVVTDRGTFTEFPYSLVPRGSENLSTLYSETSTVGYVQVIPDAGTLTPSSLGILTYGAVTGVSTLHATTEAQVPSNDLRLYVEYSGDFDHKESGTVLTSISLTNPSDSPSDVTLTLVNMNGTPTGLSTTFTLAPRGHISRYVHQLPAFSTIANPFQGLLLVHATGPGVTALGMRQRINEAGALNGTATGPIKENPGSGSTVIFPHLLDGGGYATRFVLFSDPSGAGTVGTMSFADDNGRPIPVSMDPGLLPQLFPPVLPPVTARPNLSVDFNADGKTDILWRDSFGNLFETLMNANFIIKERYLSTIWTGWTIDGGGDFNGDGRADIVWKDPNGNVAVWLMGSIRVDSFSTIGNAGAEGIVAGVGDFDHDGKAEILIRSSAGDVVLWWTDGQTVTNSITVSNVWIGWSIAGVGDFNGDGKSDILWRDPDGTLAIWLMDGATVLSYQKIGTVSPATASIAGVGDFNGDGKADILFYGADGNVSMWLMNGFNIINSGLVATMPTIWTIVGTGDYNGDGKTDILWRSAKGAQTIWFMNGFTVTSSQLVGI